MWRWRNSLTDVGAPIRPRCSLVWSLYRPNAAWFPPRFVQRLRGDNNEKSLNRVRSKDAGTRTCLHRLYWTGEPGVARRSS
jgi:hypothetical protein